MGEKTQQAFIDLLYVCRIILPGYPISYVLLCLLYTSTEWLSHLPKETEEPKLSPGTASKAYIPNHHILLPLNLLHQRPILVWVPSIADPKTRI